MKNILVYDTDEEEISKVAEDNDLMECEIIEMLMDYLEQAKEENGLK